MSKPWLILDVSHMAFRAFHTTGGLSHMGTSTGVAFGVLRDLVTLEREFHSQRFVFCFDGDGSKRKEVYPAYKANRKNGTTSGLVKAQCELLRTNYLPRLGMANLFKQDGYEADDVIASVVRNNPDPSPIIIVSGDEDLYQLLEDGVSIYRMSNGKAMTKKAFESGYGIFPNQWPFVKAIAGCTSDNIAGVEGVGQKTAIKYLRDELPHHLNKYLDCKHWHQNCAQFLQNLELVMLPYSGTERFVPTEQSDIDHDEWSALTKELGIKTLPCPGGKLPESKKGKRGILE